MLQSPISPETFKVVGKTMSGLEPVLADELENIGVTHIQLLNRAVSFNATTEQLYAANYLCRTALRFLKPIYTFVIKTEEDFYNKVAKINWENYLSVKDTFAVDASVGNSVFTHSQYVSLRCKDAIVDQFRSKYDIRPSVDPKNPDIAINVHLYNNECTIALDSSGVSLHKRGYRASVSEAPISEVLAAGMILLSNWDKKRDFYDFMCGSGTIAIEAALIAQNIPVGSFRHFYCFMKWPDFDPALFQKVQLSAKKNILPKSVKIFASDISKDAINVAKINIKQAELTNTIQLSTLDLNEIIPENPESHIVLNPPYGERIVPEDIINLYKDLGNVFKRQFPGGEAWVISSDLTALKFIGLKPSKKLILFNGPLECRFAKFEMYKGSKRNKVEE